MMFPAAKGIFHWSSSCCSLHSPIMFLMSQLSEVPELLASSQSNINIFCKLSHKRNKGQHNQSNGTCGIHMKRAYPIKQVFVQLLVSVLLILPADRKGSSSFPQDVADIEHAFVRYSRISTRRRRPENKLWITDGKSSTFRLLVLTNWPPNLNFGIWGCTYL